MEEVGVPLGGADFKGRQFKNAILMQLFFLFSKNIKNQWNLINDQPNNKTKRLLGSELVETETLGVGQIRGQILFYLKIWSFLPIVNVFPLILPLKKNKTCLLGFFFPFLLGFQGVCLIVFYH